MIAKCVCPTKAGRRHCPTFQRLCSTIAKCVVEPSVANAGNDFVNTTTKPKSAPTTTAFRPTTIVRTDSSPSDDEVLRRVTDCLAARNIASFARIGVDVRRGIITVRGDVASTGERLLLLHLLRKIPGVEQVNDGLSLTSARPVAASRTSRKGTSFSWPRFWNWMPETDFKWSVATVLLVGAIAFWFWPVGPARPVAVHPVKGKAVMEGQPMAGAHLVLYPGPDSKIPVGITSRGTVATDGTFELSTFDPKDGAPSGEFIVTVVWSKPVVVDGETQSGPSLISAVYSKPDSSPLRIKITANAKELVPIEVKQGSMAGRKIPPAATYDHE